MKKIDKVKLLSEVINRLEQELLEIEKNFNANRDEATHEESQPENQYDTRALETSYLVKGQSKRILDLQDMIHKLKFIDIKLNQDRITAGALVKVSHQDKISYLFYLPFGGGIKILIDLIEVRVITPGSPLGEALLDLKKDEVAIVENSSKDLEYEILEIC